MKVILGTEFYEHIVKKHYCNENSNIILAEVIITLCYNLDI